MWKMEVGKRAAHIDQTYSFGILTLCITDVQHENSAIFFPLMSNLRQVANLLF